jgi:hypothetical protein
MFTAKAIPPECLVIRMFVVSSNSFEDVHGVVTAPLASSCTSGWADTTKSRPELLGVTVIKLPAVIPTALVTIRH